MCISQAGYFAAERTKEHYGVDGVFRLAGHAKRRHRSTYPNVLADVGGAKAPHPGRVLVEGIILRSAHN